MQYKAEVKSYDKDDEDEATFGTWEEAADWLFTQQRYHGHGCSMWLNNERVKFEDFDLVKVKYATEGSPTPLVTDAKLVEKKPLSHEAFIEEKYFKLFEIVCEITAGIEHGTVVTVGQVHEMLQPSLPSFRPQPTRGSAPQNPATLAAKGEGV